MPIPPLRTPATLYPQVHLGARGVPYGTGVPIGVRFWSGEDGRLGEVLGVAWAAPWLRRAGAWRGGRGGVEGAGVVGCWRPDFRH